jgi:hypothetical protein
MKTLQTLIILICYSTSFAQFSVSPESIDLPKVAILPTCNSGSIGKLTYLTTTNKAYLCNGTTWQEISKLVLPETYSITSTSTLLDIHNTGFGVGIRSKSSKGYGLQGESTSSNGVDGKSTNSVGVSGSSIEDYGGSFKGKKGVYAKGTDWALRLEGKLNLQSSTGVTGNTIVVNSEGEPIWQPNVAFAVKDVGIGTQAIPNITETKVNFDIEEYDLDNNFAPSTNTFTAPYNGVYHFDAAITWLGPITAFGIYEMNLRVGNTDIFSVRLPAFETYSQTQMLNADLSLNAGETVSIVVFQNSQKTQYLSAESKNSRFSGRLVIRQ